MPIAATAMRRMDASPKRIWNLVTDVEGYAARVPLIERVNIRGDLAEFRLRFGLALFSARFSFQSTIHKVEERSLVLSYQSGEPKDLTIEYVIDPIPDRPDAALLAVYIGFDVGSVGWLARFFLKHHPEIQYGIHAGCALALVESIHKALKNQS
jgi:ribosome-associated toxin RatA of RatAB toxin-antitoxin module